MPYEMRHVYPTLYQPTRTKGGIHQRSMHEVSPALDHSDCKIFEHLLFENKNSCNLCDLISKTILGLETHFEGQ